MSLLQAKTGGVQAVLAHPEDSYLLPGLAALGLKEYLYCLLKRQGWEAVYFLGGGEEEHTLSLFDQPSRELYRKNGRKAKGLMGLFSGDDAEDSRSYSLGGGAECVRRLSNMVRKGKNQVFVISLDTFRELFAHRPQELEDFSRLFTEDSQSGENLLLLHLPRQGLSDLRDPEGIFVQRGLWLSSEEGTQLTVLSDFSPEGLLPVLKRVYLTRCFAPDWQPEELWELAVFLSSWYASGALRAQTGLLFSENEERRFSVLLRELSDGDTLDKARQAMQAQKLRAGDECLEQYLPRVYPPEDAPCNI